MIPPKENFEAPPLELTLTEKEEAQHISVVMPDAPVVPLLPVKPAKKDGEPEVISASP